MADKLTIEERLAAVEAAVADLQRRLPPADNAWLGQVMGIMKGEPAFEEVVAYGREMRRADRLSYGTPRAPAHREAVVLTEDGRLTVGRLPFRAGQAVEVVVQPVAGPAPGDDLRGSVIRYDGPTDPVSADDWKAVK